ncbi:hypothetical protein BC827DRAFT_1270678 [Russula dissimulans]|nr:hypothetical protein BC827DRAFT_1270678 [Russula dissimulans]
MFPFASLMTIYSLITPMPVPTSTVSSADDPHRIAAAQQHDPPHGPVSQGTIHAHHIWEQVYHTGR